MITITRDHLSLERFLKNEDWNLVVLIAVLLAIFVVLVVDEDTILEMGCGVDCGILGGTLVMTEGALTAVLDAFRVFNVFLDDTDKFSLIFTTLTPSSPLPSSSSNQESFTNILLLTPASLLEAEAARMEDVGVSWSGPIRAGMVPGWWWRGWHLTNLEGLLEGLVDAVDVEGLIGAVVHVEVRMNDAGIGRTAVFEGPV